MKREPHRTPGQAVRKKKGAVRTRPLRTLLLAVVLGAVGIIGLGILEGSLCPRTKPRIRASVKTGPAQRAQPFWDWAGSTLLPMVEAATSTRTGLHRLLASGSR
jgi:hypothetical protein